MINQRLTPNSISNIMKSLTRSMRWVIFAGLIPLLAPIERVTAGPATLLFQDDFNTGIPGWNVVVPAGANWQVSPTILCWTYDATTKAFSEHSNIYTDSATFSSSRVSTMMINATVAPTNFTYSARLTAGDDDAFGLIWGFEDETRFYRITFTRQNRGFVGWPYYGCVVDRMNNGQITDVKIDSSFVNTAGRPFDVILKVNNGLLSVIIVDDPLVSSLTNNWVTDLPLPTVPVSNKVGIFTWGMSGNVAGVRSFMIQNPVLSPTPLTGDPASQVLSNWSFLITPREADGSVPAGAVPPIWGVAVDANGSRGRLSENSDWTVDNIVAAYTNCPVPAAVAGDVNWSNYVYSARFFLNDDDGFGMFLRYQNETNFYRIAFRNQSTAAGGIRRGLSVQKNVNRVFDQLYSNSVAGFIPPIGGSYEVHAFVRANTLQIIGIVNPDAASPVAATSGAIDMGASSIVPGNLNSGKIGLFSWAMFTGGVPTLEGTEVDFVKVSQVAGEGLIVSSAFATPDPPVGLNDLPISTVVTASVASAVQTAPDIRQVNTGWSGLGSVPAIGTSNQSVFTLTSFSSITWQWQTQYLLTTNTTAGGSITNPSPAISNWVPENASVTLVAVASNGYIFTGWSGDSLLASSTSLTFPMVRPVSLTANFAPDSDGDGLPDAWEMLYFGNLTSQNDTGDPDGDGVSNLVELGLGTNPSFAETVTVTDGLSSQWTNTCRDPGLPGEVTVVDFGSGYRGAFNSDNLNRDSADAAFIPANNLSNNVSFQTPRLIVRSNAWNTAWGTNFSASWELSVGDNDANCFYFRYVNESNWFRVTLCGEDPLLTLTRPPINLSVQRRTNGFHSDIPLTYVSGPLFAAYTDPTDGAGTPAGFKKVRVTVSATNQNFEVRAIGWNAFLGTPGFDPTYELVETFVNDSPNVQAGRIGFAPWGEGGFGLNTNQVNGIPIPFGAFVDNIAVRSPFSDSPVVFSENWETAALATSLPAGWTNPYAGFLPLEGTWVVNVDGSISQLANQGGLTTGTALDPKADADANVLLAPNQTSGNYYVQVGFHAFDNDGVGIVYDFRDTNNYSRVMFRQEATFATDVPPGLSVSRKSGGVWTDITAGDPSFLYTPGRPFEVTLANNNGDYNLAVRDLENPAAAATRWHWTGPSSAAANRFGVTTWFSANAHVLYARASALPTIAPAVPFKITNISRSGGNVVLDISKPGGSSYHVLRAASVTGPYLTNAANQTASQYIEPAPAGTTFYRLQLLP